MWGGVGGMSEMLSVQQARHESLSSGPILSVFVEYKC